MNDHEVDPWIKEELLAVRHAGTVYAGAIAIIAALHKESPINEIGSFDLKFGLGLLLIGTAGSVAYQLFTIQLKGQGVTVARTLSAICVASGFFGFLLLALDVIKP